MKLFLVLWITPLTLLGGWYGLSYHDINFGYRILSRELHDLVFAIYGSMLGMAPEAIPPLVLKAIVVDTGLVLGFILLKRRRKQIWRALKSLLRLNTGSGEAALEDPHEQAPELSRGR